MPLPRVEYDPDGDASPLGVVQRVDTIGSVRA
jgi:hypothetical protein